MKIALTGATGFVGGHILRRAREAGHHVAALTRSPHAVREDADWILGSLEDHAALRKLCASADAVVHAAGVVNGDAAAFDLGNRVGTMAILAAAEAQRVPRFVHISSLSAREPTLSLYGGSKRAAEDAVAASSLDWRIVRPPAIYGPGDAEQLDLFKFAKRGLIPLPPAGRLSLIHADDLARLILAVAKLEPRRSIYEPDDGVPGGWSHRDYARAIADAVRSKAMAIPLPAALIGLGARIDGWLRGDRAKLTADRAAYFCHPDWVADPAARPDPSLWVPHVETRAGLAETARWYRSVGWL